MDLSLETTCSDRGWSVRLAVTLDRRETSDLFLVGDKLISWPTDGLRAGVSAGPVERSSMFLSEMAARPQGLSLEYETEELAARAARILAYQVRTALTGE